MSYGAIAVSGIGMIVNMSNAAKNRRMAREQYEDAKILRDKERKELEAQMEEYKAQKFENPYLNMQNPFANLTVNTQTAEFQAKQGAAQRANIMAGLKSAAGASGVAGLAQALANQGQLQTAQIAAGLGRQEQANALAAAKGAAANQIAERQGEQMLQQMEANRQATLLGMQMAESTGANLAAQQAQANELNAAIASQQTTANMFATMGTGVAKGADKLGGKTGNIFTKQVKLDDGTLKNIPFFKSSSSI